MSHLLTRRVAEKAVEFVLPSVLRMMEDTILKRKDLHIVIANPLVPDNVKESFWPEKGILYEHSLGKPSDWAFPYDKIARSKCYLTWRHGMPTQILLARAPFLLGKDSTLYYGSAFCDGLAVACSGVQPYFDQMISSWVLEACRALCIQGLEAMGDGDHGFVA